MPGLGTHLVKPSEETYLSQCGVGRQGAFVSKDVSPAPSIRIQLTQKFKTPAPTSSPTSLKDYITVIKVTPDRKDLAGYPVHPLLVQGFLLQPGPHCRALSGS